MNKKEKEIKQVLEKLKEKDLKTMEKFKEKTMIIINQMAKLMKKKNLNQISNGV